MSTFFLEILQYTLSGILIACFTLFLIKQFFEKENVTSNYNKQTFSEIDKFKLQALERLLLFVERIRPNEAFVRLYSSGISAKELQINLLTEIKAEYNHNITQQLYINQDTWEIVKRVKEDTLVLINKSYSALPENSSAIDYSKLVFSKLDELETNPYDLAISVIKNELNQY